MRTDRHCEWRDNLQFDRWPSQNNFRKKFRDWIFNEKKCLERWRIRSMALHINNNQKFRLNEPQSANHETLPFAVRIGSKQLTH